MTPELTALAWTLLLALAQILLAAQLRTFETGIAYNASPRDEKAPAPIGTLTGRMQRAQSNLLETLPIFAAAVLIAHVAGIHSPVTEWAAWLYLIGRLMHLPLYALGVPYLRSMAWLLSLAGILTLIFVTLNHG